MSKIKGIDIPQANSEVQGIYSGLEEMRERLEQWQAQLEAIQPQELPEGWYPASDVRREAKRIAKLLNSLGTSIGRVRGEMSTFRTWFGNMAKEYPAEQAKTARSGYNYDRRG